VHPAPRRRPMPGSGPRRHDTRDHLIAPRACRETSLPASQHYCPGASQGACDAGDDAKIAPSTTAAATNFLPRSAIRRRLPRPAQPLRKTPPRQIPIVGRPPTRPPAGSFLGGFRMPAAAPGGSVTTGRHPKPYTDPAAHPGRSERRVCTKLKPLAFRQRSHWRRPSRVIRGCVTGNSTDRLCPTR
jgi:hypothetical protein